MPNAGARLALCGGPEMGVGFGRRVSILHRIDAIFPRVSRTALAVPSGKHVSGRGC